MKSPVEFRHLLACATRHWIADNASTTGAALAFYCAFSLAPLLIILLTIAGAVVDAEVASNHIAAQLAALFGPATSQVLMEAVKGSQQVEGTWATLLSVATLVVGATTVLSALDAALERIWQSGKLLPAGIRGWVRTRLLSLAFILALGFLLLVSLTLSTGMASLQNWIADRHATLVGSIGVLNFLISLFLVSGLFTLIYRYMPARRLPWKTVITGGVLTAVLFDLGKWLVGLYLARSTQASAFGAAAAFAALLLWLYYNAQIFLFGAEFTACLGGLRARGSGEEGNFPTEKSTAA